MSSFPGACDLVCKQPVWADTITHLVNSVASNFTGYTPTIRVKFSTGTVSYSTAAGVTCNSSGEVSWSLDVSAWPTGFVGYDIQVTPPASTVPVWLLEGVLEVRP